MLKVLGEKPGRVQRKKILSLTWRAAVAPCSAVVPSQNGDWCVPCSRFGFWAAQS